MARRSDLGLRSLERVLRGLGARAARRKASAGDDREPGPRWRRRRKRRLRQIWARAGLRLSLQKILCSQRQPQSWKRIADE
jgi:hypothetical protein